MSTNLITHNFSAGELSPQLTARTDLAKYHQGLAICRNFFVDYRSGVSTRQGTKYIAATKDASTAVRIVAFQITGVQGYILEFGNLYFRVYKNGVLQAEVVTTYVTADLFPSATNPGLKFSQSVSVLTVTHPSYVARNIIRTSDTVWSITNVGAGSPLSTPAPNIVLTALTGLPDSTTWGVGYAVTAVDANGQESLPGYDTETIANVLSPDYVSAEISWAAVTNAVYYNVYKTSYVWDTVTPAGQVHGFIGSCTNTTTKDINYVPDFAVGPPVAQSPLVGNSPGCSAFYQQRQVFAGSTASPQTFWMSTPAGYTSTTVNFNTSFPAQLDDAITGTLVSNSLSPIRHLITMPTGLVALGSYGAWLISGGGQNAAITIVSAQGNPQAFSGCSDLRPLVINYDLLYVEAAGNRVRDLTYNFYVNIYTGTDISVLSDHLFFNYTIVDWTWTEAPFKTVWAVRNDGVLLSLAFLKEQEIQGWGRHDTNGLFMSTATVREGQVDATYFVVKRLIGGSYVQYIERMAERTFTYGIEDSWSLDAALQSSPTSTPAATLTASQSATGTGVTFTASGAVFNSGHVGKIIRMGGGIATITGFTSSTVVTGTITQAISAVIPGDSAATPVPQTSGNWAIWTNATTFSGLSHLNGKTVNACADGAAVTGLTVSGGSVTIPNAASKVTVGLPFTAQLQTMYLDMGEPTVQGKRKKVSAITLRLKESRGLSAGRTFSTLVAIKETSPPILAAATGLVTTDERVVMDPLWDVPGQICIQQTNPWPATVLGVIPEIIAGDNSK